MNQQPEKLIENMKKKNKTKVVKNLITHYLKMTVSQNND